VTTLPLLCHISTGKPKSQEIIFYSRPASSACTSLSCLRQPVLPAPACPACASTAGSGGRIVQGPAGSGGRIVQGPAGTGGRTFQGTTGIGGRTVQDTAGTGGRTVQGTSGTGGRTVQGTTGTGGGQSRILPVKVSEGYRRESGCHDWNNPSSLSHALAIRITLFLQI
jgi:hypothetical protein